MTKSKLWLRNLKEVLLGCVNDSSHPVTYKVNDGFEPILMIQDKPLIKEGISTVDIFECLGIGNEVDISEKTDTTLMIADWLTDNYSKAIYEVTSGSGINLCLFFRDSNHIGHIVNDPKNSMISFEFPHGYTLEELNEYWEKEQPYWSLVPKK